MRRHAQVLLAAALGSTASLLVSFATAQPPSVVINEIYYDAPGADAGAQFVELFNRDSLVVSLAGFRLEAGDGAGPERWHVLWSGQAGDVIPPRGRFVIGEAHVMPAPDRLLGFDLENGPDALRLTAPDGARDVVGYGTLTYASYFEGRPAEDVAAGNALARSPDGADTDDNAADFVALTPATPGAPNRPERDAALARVSPDAERLEPGDAVTLRGFLVNKGAGPLAAHEIEVLLWAAPRAPDTGTTVGQGDMPLAPDSLVARLDAPGDLDPGDSLAIALSFTPPGPGAWDVTLATRIEDDGAPANDRADARLQVGPGALIVNEVASAPGDAGPEWVELLNVSSETLALFDWTLEDATGRRASVIAPGVAGGAFDVAPESLVVLTSDPAALLVRHPELPAGKVAACQPWPALNNDPQGESPADRVVIRAPGGRVSDAMDLPGNDPPGATLERRARTSPSRATATWGASASPGGTPARTNSIGGGPPAPGVALVASDRPAWPAHNEGALLRYRTGFERATITLSVYDLRGRKVRALLDHADGPGQAGVAWDGRGAGGQVVAPGLYVAGLEAKDAAGSPEVARARAFVVVR